MFGLNENIENIPGKRPFHGNNDDYGGSKVSQPVRSRETSEMARTECHRNPEGRKGSRLAVLKVTRIYHF